MFNFLYKFITQKALCYGNMIFHMQDVSYGLSSRFSGKYNVVIRTL